MSWIKNILDAIRGSEDFSDIKSSSIRDILNGNILTKKFFQKQYGLLIMMAVLAFFYVDNRYSCESQIAKEDKLAKEIQDVKYESMTISAELMQLCRQSKVEEMITKKGLDLEAPLVAPYVIEDSIPEK
jgi:Bacteriodetes cell division protein (FtsL-like)